MVVEYFKGQKWLAGEGKKFFWYYEAIGWKMGGKYPIEDWWACAKSWMIRAGEIKKESSNNGLSQNWDNLKVKKNKDYGEPL